MAPEDLRRGIPFDALRAGVPARDAAVGVEHEDRAVLQAVEEQAEALLSMSEPFLGTLSLGDVAEHGQHVAATRARQPGFNAPGFSGRRHSELELFETAPCNQAADGREGALGGAGREDLSQRPAVERCWCTLKDALRAADAQDDAVGAQLEDQVAEHLEQGVVHVRRWMVGRRAHGSRPWCTRPNRRTPTARGSLPGCVPRRRRRRDRRRRRTRGTTQRPRSRSVPSTARAT